MLSKRRPEPGPLATPCWVYTGYIKPEGYGEGYLNGAKVYVHRVAYENLVGPIPEGLQLDHLCRNRACFNPLHLEPVTSRENTMRGENWSAKRAVQTECLRGHAFTDENTYVRPNGTRWCKECGRARSRGYHAARREVAEVRIKPAVGPDSYTGRNQQDTEKGEAE